MAVDKLLQCNLALGEVPSDAIESFEERSSPAEWCARLYSPTLAYCIDRHDWKFNTARVALATLEVNDRPGEWSYAYAIPEECISELRVLPPYDSSGNVVPLLAGQALAPWAVGGLTIPALYRYLVAGNVLYSNIENATLEYIQAEPNAQTFRPLFSRAFQLELASRLVMPVINKRERQGDLIKMAEVAMDRAIADELNRDDSQSSYGDFVNETEQARSGFFMPTAFGLWPTG